MPFISKSNKKFLTQAFADDLNLTTGSLQTLLRVINILEDFKKVSGLKVNLDKTHGFFFNKSGLLSIDYLPLNPSNWNCDLKILGIPFKSPGYVQNFWRNLLSSVQESVSRYNCVYSTFDAKSIITKALILPKFLYVASVINIPPNIKQAIDRMVYRYIIPNGNMNIKLIDLAQKRVCGGYNIDCVSIHASIFSLLPIFKYAYHKVNNIPLTKEQFFIEYNLGFQLARILKVPMNNSTPHRMTPMKSYALILKLIRDMHITGDELVKGRIKLIYEKYIFSLNSQRSFLSSDWKRLHLKIFPNYIKTFNFKASVDILPCKTKFVDFGLDTDSRCNFCDFHADTVQHIFCHCPNF